MKLTLDPKSNPIALKTTTTPECADLIRREADILRELKHPLVLELSETPACRGAIVTADAGQGSLAGHFTAESELRRPNRFAKIVTSIAIATRFAHSRAVTHCDLKPENILLDWNWNVRIAGFRRSSSSDVPSRYLAPECYDNVSSPRAMFSQSG
jgi:serine/threonine protein kinase